MISHALSYDPQASAPSLQSRSETPLGTLLTTVPYNYHRHRGHGVSVTHQLDATSDTLSINCHMTSIGVYWSCG